MTQLAGTLAFVTQIEAVAVGTMQLIFQIWIWRAKNLEHQTVEL